MDGLQALERIMKESPVPVLMVSSLTSEGGEITRRALEMGAVDFIDKSSCHTTMDILDISESLIQKIKVIAGVDLRKVVQSKPVRRSIPVSPVPLSVTVSDERPSHLVAIGTSTGGPMSLEQVLTPLPANYPGAILIVQHMPVGFTSSLAERMDRQCAMAVKEAEEGDTILPGHIYIAPGGYHLKICRSISKYSVVLSKNPCDMPHCPSVDVMMQSIAETWPGKVLGVIMTGMGNDGARGCRQMKQRGATIIAQDEASCVVFGMPREPIEKGIADVVKPLDDIADEIVRLAGEGVVACK